MFPRLSDFHLGWLIEIRDGTMITRDKSKLFKVEKTIINHEWACLIAISINCELLKIQLFANDKKSIILD